MQFRAEILQLAALRQSRGITLERIADDTKISLYYLRAIENCDFDKLPSGVYTDNFLCQYAKAIDSELADELHQKLTHANQEAAQAAASPVTNNTVVRVLKDMLARGTAVAFLMSAGSGLMAQGSGDAQATVSKDDPRVHLIRKFFEDCPLAANAADFVVAADRNGLDWRLLPSIAFLESTGGKYLKGFNPLGWNSGETRFRSMAHAIHHVANRLANAPVYANKTLRAKLKKYNPARPDYPDKVMATMEKISPSTMSRRLTPERDDVPVALQAQLIR